MNDKVVPLSMDQVNQSSNPSDQIAMFLPTIGEEMKQLLKQVAGKEMKFCFIVFDEVEIDGQSGYRYNYISNADRMSSAAVLRLVCDEKLDPVRIHLPGHK